MHPGAVLEGWKADLSEQQGLPFNPLQPGELSLKTRIKIHR
jgi:hypothetical protein